MKGLAGSAVVVGAGQEAGQLLAVMAGEDRGRRRILEEMETGPEVIDEAALVPIDRFFMDDGEDVAAGLGIQVERVLEGGEEVEAGEPALVAGEGACVADEGLGFGVAAGLLVGDEQVIEHPRLDAGALAPVGEPMGDLAVLGEACEDVADLAPERIVFLEPLGMGTQEAAKLSARGGEAGWNAPCRGLADRLADSLQLADEGTAGQLGSGRQPGEDASIGELADGGPQANPEPGRIRVGAGMEQETPDVVFGHAAQAGG